MADAEAGAAGGAMEAVLAASAVAAAPEVASWGLEESIARYEFFIESKSGNWFCGPGWTEDRDEVGVVFALGVVRGAGGKN